MNFGEIKEGLSRSHLNQDGKNRLSLIDQIQVRGKSMCEDLHVGKSGRFKELEKDQYNWAPHWRTAVGWGHRQGQIT